MEKKLDVGKLIATGWALATKNFLYFLGIFAIMIGYNIVFSIIRDVLNRAEAPMLLIFIFNLVIWVFGVIIGLGITKISIDLVGGKKDPITTLFTTYKPTFKYIVSSFIYSFLTILPLFMVIGLFALVNVVFAQYVKSNLGGLAMINVILASLGVATLVYAIIVGIRLSFFSYFMIDKDTGIIESLKASFDATKGNVMSLFVLQLALTGINILGVLALFVGLLITAPLAMTATAAAYRELNSTSKKDPIPASPTPAIEKLKASLAS